MKIERVVVGYLEENCYLLDINNKVMVIDPGDEATLIIDKISNREVIGIFITHEHFDHIGAVDELVKKYKCKVYNYNNLKLGENKFGDFKFDVLYKPGHKDDLICFYFKEDKKLFCGDFIFKDSIGRCDLDGENYNDMLKSISEILELPDDVIIYPGHYETTSIGYERNNLTQYIQ